MTRVWPEDDDFDFDEDEMWEWGTNEDGTRVAETDKE